MRITVDNRFETNVPIRYIVHLTAALMLICAVVFYCAIPVAAAEDNRVTVRVGYVFDGDYMYKDSQGQYRGYEVEYLYALHRKPAGGFPLRIFMIATAAWLPWQMTT
jgi:hypothetical protein